MMPEFAKRCQFIFVFSSNLDKLLLFFLWNILLFYYMMNLILFWNWNKTVLEYTPCYISFYKRCKTELNLPSNIYFNIKIITFYFLLFDNLAIVLITHFCFLFIECMVRIKLCVRFPGRGVCVHWSVNVRKSPWSSKIKI